MRMNFLTTASVAASLLLMTGCASVGPVNGAIYADVQGPISATSNVRGSARGEACAQGYVGLIAMGDASISAAMKNGGLANISHVEQHSTSILGLYVNYCTIVWGSKGGKVAAAGAPHVNGTMRAPASATAAPAAEAAPN